MSPDPILRLDGVTVQFGGLRALDNVSFDVTPGEVRGLIGPNGAGKTTLINCVSGALRPTSGGIVLNGEIGPWNVRGTVARGLCRTFQTPRAFLGLTVRGNLQAAASPHSGSTSHGVVDEFAERFGLTDRLSELAADLPYGVLRRLSIALALCTKPHVLLLDEPAVGLTSEEVKTLAASIRGLQATGVTILLVEHNMRFLMSVSDRVVVLDQGRVIFTGTASETQRDPAVIESYLGKRSKGEDNARN